MDKKAQGLSLNVIIIAAIALLVLVILSIIFMGRMSIFGPGTASCENKGGRCATFTTACGEGELSEYARVETRADYECPDDETYTGTCCMRELI